MQPCHEGRQTSAATQVPLASMAAAMASASTAPQPRAAEPPTVSLSAQLATCAHRTFRTRSTARAVRPASTSAVVASPPCARMPELWAVVDVALSSRCQSPRISKSVSSHEGVSVGADADESAEPSPQRIIFFPKAQAPMRRITPALARASNRTKPAATRRTGTPRARSATTASRATMTTLCPLAVSARLPSQRPGRQPVQSQPVL